MGQNPSEIWDSQGHCSGPDLLNQILQLPVEKPQRLLLAAEPRTTFIATLLGLLSQGHLVIPYPPDLPRSAVQQLQKKYQLGLWQESAGAPWSEPGTLGLLTSGSTGESKIVLMQAAQCFSNSLSVIEASQLNPMGPLGIILPLHHSFGLITQLLPALLQGSSVYLSERLRFPGDLGDFLNRHPIQTLAGVPTQFALLAMGGTPTFEQIRHVTIAGAALSSDFARKLHALFPKASLWIGYGLTEAGPRVTTLSDQDPHWKEGSVGQALPGVELRIQEGEIWVNSPSNMLGYLDRPGMTKEVLHEGWLATGDLGHLSPEGYLFIQGRKDDMFQSGGEKVSPRAVEVCLEQHELIEHVAVTGVPDTHLGHKIAAFIQHTHPLSKGDLRGFCKTHLPPHLIPHEYYTVQSLPQTPNGKLKRKALLSWPTQQIR